MALPQHAVKNARMTLMEEPETSTVVCDYLVIGAGVQGLAFTDALLGSDKKATVAIVDRNAQPGGVYNHTHSFMTLESHSYYTGVGSLPLEAAAPGKDDMLAYFQQVMQKLIATGRVRYFPRCTADGGSITAVLNPACSWKVDVRRKVVDATYARVRVPAAADLPYAVEGGVTVVAPSQLSSISRPHPQYVVIGGGRTAMDTVLWLLSEHVAPDQVCWVRPREAWLISKEWTDCSQYAEGMQTFNETVASLQGQETIDDLYLMMENQGVVSRIDPETMPSMFHYACVSQDELEKLRQVKDVVRLGHVFHVGSERLVLEHGSVKIARGALHINCANSWIQDSRPAVPIFSPGRITLQLLAELNASQHNFAWGAATIGFLETQDHEDEQKNELLLPARPSDTPSQYMQACLDEHAGRLWKDRRLANFVLISYPGRWRCIGAKKTGSFFRQLEGRKDVYASKLARLLEMNETKLQKCSLAVSSAASTALNSPRSSSSPKSAASAEEVQDRASAEEVQDRVVQAELVLRADSLRYIQAF